MLVELEREPLEGLSASPARSTSIGEEAKKSEVVAKVTLIPVREARAKARHEPSVNAARWGIRGKGCVCVPWMS